MGSTGYWEIRTYECGALGEKTKYWVPGEPPARGRKLGRSSARKQRQNENDAARRLNREIHANFSAGDLFLGLDYGPTKHSELLRRAEARQEADRAAGQEPGILEDYLRKEANRELDNFIRRVKRRLPPGAELKYISSYVRGGILSRTAKTFSTNCMTPAQWMLLRTPIMLRRGMPW